MNSELQREYSIIRAEALMVKVTPDFYIDNPLGRIAAWSENPLL